MRKIEVVAYNPAWPEMFKQEAEKIKRALGDNCLEVHHIGSTSVPGLAAKPLIDMIPVVRDITKVDAANDALKALGYEPQGEFGIPFRRYFQKGGDNRTHHVHIFEQGSPEIERHLKFRDWMRSHPEDALAYGELKQQLAQQFPYDSLGYCNGKDAFIGAIDAKAGMSLEPRLMFVCTDREWEIYHTMCEKYLFEPIGMTYDRNYPTIRDPRHYHFVLYVGTKIVSLVHVEDLEGGSFAVRSLATLPEERNKGYASTAMKFAERWMRQQGCSVVRLHAAHEAISLYRELGYEDMPWAEDTSIDLNAVDLGKRL